MTKKGNINRLKLLQNSPIKSDRADPNNVDLTRYKDDWYRFIIHKLVMNCTESADLLKNDVRFITFNYDVSLEQALYKGLSSIELLERDDINNFWRSDRRLHIYGNVRDDVSLTPPLVEWDILLKKDINPDRVHHQKYKDAFDVAYYASKRLRVIDPGNKTADADVIKAAQDAIRNAKCVYILGYGFDKTNSDKILKLGELLHERNCKWVLFTNYQDSNRITKRASTVLFGLPNERFRAPLGSISGNNHYFEMSTRDTYEALELDFDVPDDEPRP
jgi:hypothetical protein